MHDGTPKLRFTTPAPGLYRSGAFLIRKWAIPSSLGDRYTASYADRSLGAFRTLAAARQACNTVAARLFA